MELSDTGILGARRTGMNGGAPSEPAGYLPGAPAGTPAGRPAELTWLVGRLRASGAEGVRVSPDWEWVTFRPARRTSRVCLIVRFPPDGAYTVSRYDSRLGTCELMGEYPDAAGALRAALA